MPPVDVIGVYALVYIQGDLKDVVSALFKGVYPKLTIFKYYFEYEVKIPPSYLCADKVLERRISGLPL